MPLERGIQFLHFHVFERLNILAVDAEIVFDYLPVFIVGLEKLAGKGSLRCCSSPDIRIGKRIEQWIIVHRGSILVKLNRLILIIFDADNQAVVVE